MPGGHDKKDKKHKKDKKKNKPIKHFDKKGKKQMKHCAKQELALDPDEFITYFAGRAGHCIDRLTIRTSKGK